MLSSRSSGPYSRAVLPAGSSSQGDTVHRQHTWERKWNREREGRERGGRSGGWKGERSKQTGEERKEGVYSRMYGDRRNSSTGPLV